MPGKATTAEYLELGDTVQGSDGRYKILDIDQLPSGDIRLYFCDPASDDEWRMLTRPGAPFTVLR